MINVAEVLRAVPKLESFCSVQALHGFVEALPHECSGFDVKVVGRSGNGLPIHHIRFGEGRLKALFVGFPHANEPIGGLTAFSLLTLLRQQNSALLEADVEWHIVPCIDPDGATLNEGWSQQEFSLENYLRHFHRQEPCDQVDCSFPVEHKNLRFSEPTVEARALQQLLDTIRPDFFYSLHNAWTGGAWYCLTRDVGKKYRDQLYGLLEEQGIPLQTSPLYRELLGQFDVGMVEHFTVKKFYDFLEQTHPHPEELLHMGASSWEYLQAIKAGAMALVTELPYVRHPSDGSSKPTGSNLRQLKLRLDADAKFIATVILEEWSRVQQDLDTHSPFYKKIDGGLIQSKDKLLEGLPSWPYKTRDLLFNPAYSVMMTEGERFNAYLMHGFWLLCHSYEFVRLLQASDQTVAVRRAIDRLEPIFATALEEISRNIEPDKFATIDCSTLVKVQLGSGLIVMNWLLEGRSISGSGA